MSSTDYTPLVIARTLRILASEIWLLAESVPTPDNPDMLASIRRDLAEIGKSITRCADDLETGHT